jgi:hypothetical protein
LEKLKFTEVSALGNLVVVLTLFLGVVWQFPKFDFFSDPAPYVHLHSILESIAILASLVVGLLALSHQSRDQNNYLIALGVGFLSVCLIDIFHTLSYQGMPDFFGPSDPEKAINFWLAGRVLTAVSILGVALMPASHWRQGVRYGVMLAGVLLVALVFVMGFLYSDLLPRTFIEGQGLTPLKIAIELLIFAVFGLATLMLLRRRKNSSEDRQGLDFAYLAAGAWVLGLAELFFTLYGSVTDMFNLMGHLYKIIGTLMVLMAMKGLARKNVQRAA